jgi:hypothetical protein
MRASEFGPSGCAICGFPQTSHYFDHAFAPPVQAEILMRMLKRRELRQNPDLRDKPPMVALYLGHRLRLCKPPFFGAAPRWVCGDCSRYTVRSGGTEYGSAVTEPCKTRNAQIGDQD